MTSEAHFYKNGKLLYIASLTAGLAGIGTGMKPGAFVISVNERHNGKTYINIILGTLLNNIYELAFKKANPNNFEDAVKYLKNVEMPAGCYLIISGINKNEGIVITRSYENVVNFYSLNDTNWFIVQTNYDRDVPDPKKDYRRIPAENKIKSIGQDNINEQIVFDNILSQSPNFRRDNKATIMTASMSAQTGYFNQTIWLD